MHRELVPKRGKSKFDVVVAEYNGEKVSTCHELSQCREYALTVGSVLVAGFDNLAELVDCCPGRARKRLERLFSQKVNEVAVDDQFHYRAVRPFGLGRFADMFDKASEPTPRLRRTHLETGAVVGLRCPA